MKETKYTKGEWSSKGIHIKCEGKVGRIGQAFLMNFKHDTRGRSIPDEEGPANARLMAAAPDLLKALQGIRTHWSNGNFSRDKELWEAMDNAIKKALDDGEE